MNNNAIYTFQQKTQNQFTHSLLDKTPSATFTLKYRHNSNTQQLNNGNNKKKQIPQYTTNVMLSNLFVKVDSKRKKGDVNKDLHHSHVEGDKEMEIWLYCGTMGCWPAQESGFNGFLAIVLTALHMSAS